MKLFIKKTTKANSLVVIFIFIIQKVMIVITECIQKHYYLGIDQNITNQ